MAGFTGVGESSLLKPKIGTKGKISVAPGDFVIVKDMESIGISFDNGVEEWNALDQDGWTRRLMTAKSMTVSFSGKRHYGDPGNDYVAGLAYENGQTATSVLEITFPNTAKLTMPCVINVSENGGGDATAVGALVFDCVSDGKPTYTKPV